MRAHAISSHSGFPSDTNLLVDACIARVRATARLDDDAVLPPLPVVTPRRDVVIFSKEQSAGSAAAVRLACRTPATAGDELGGGAARSVVTQLVSRRSGSRRSRWAIFLCAVVASAFGTAAFLGSPAGHAPSVVRATTAARSQANAAARATAALFTR